MTGLPLLPGKGRAGQRGVALLAVLWVLAAAGTAAALGLAAVRDGIATSRYRTEYSRARWAAEGCLAELRARLEQALGGSNPSGPSVLSVAAADAWIDPRPGIPAGCSVRLDPPREGPVDVNAASDSTLRTLPGFDADVLEALRRERVWGRRLQSLDELLGVMPPDIRERLAARYAELVGRVAFVPPAWVVTGEGTVAGRWAPVVSEWWMRAGNRIAVVRREVR